ncbi:RNA polymerase ii subunit b1 ctd phosphatase rpap2 [Chrysochromulina tobinii]|uniref:RNA polymerase II subunit B1 CTD phosphatase RPAP2 homolog n=1 Tax=Chrysochromulina tobinii TaxID=1460289 RepID=A0A0M0J7H3_9EUKA|nr:RNA polymerase ii subunit b1 ctd phosphatase rpap2 [Chrysochromulina tobinii]|eukprot:KOO22534.1 RNA polymerase ii subunit b1 ctd phosphatase rpap2 [Chrysochromulina sp. CCMP291]
MPPVPSTERAALEASIRAKVNCEKAAYNMQWELLEPGVTAEQLEAAARVLQPSHYEDIVAERAIDGLCGYPPCTNAAPLKGQGPKFHVSIDDRRVYDISSLHSFCGRECARRSHAYATSLSTTSLFLREGVAAALAPATAAGAEREAAAAATRQDAADARRSGAARVLDDAIPAYAFGVMGLNEAEAATKTAAKAAATRAAAKAKTQRAAEGNASSRSTAERVGQAGLGTTERTVRMEYG